MSYTILIHENHPKVKQALTRMLHQSAMNCTIILTDSDDELIEYLETDSAASLNMLLVETKALDNDIIYRLLKARRTQCQLILLNTFLDEMYYKLAEQVKALALLGKTTDISLLNNLIIEDINKCSILTPNT